MTAKKTSANIDITSRLEQLEYFPVRENVPSAPEEEVLQFKKDLRQYFLHENADTPGGVEEVYPLLTAPFLRATHELPVLFLQAEDSFIGLAPFLERTLEVVFAETDPTLLARFQKDLLKRLPEKVAHQDQGYPELVAIVVEELRGVEGMDETLADRIEVVEKLLLSADALVLGAANRTVFQLLNVHLVKAGGKMETFRQRLRSVLAGLENLLQLHDKDPGTKDPHFDFAKGMMAFDKIAKIEAQSLSSELPEARLQGIRQSLEVLKAALASYQTGNNTIFVNQDLATAFSLRTILTTGRLEMTAGSSGAAARSYLEQELPRFVETIGALRLAELEISQKYEEDLHTPYFEKFNVSFLGDDDYQFFRPVILIEDAAVLSQSSQDMLALLSSEAPVKILSVNRLDQIGKQPAELDLERSLELASLAIIRRNTFIFQGGLDAPELIYDALTRSLPDTVSALWNILLPGNADGGKSDWIALRAAAESRYFPRFVYDVRTGQAFSSHFDLSGNPQSEKVFPVLPLEIETASGKESASVELTMADFWAILPSERQRLFLIPAAFADDSMIPLRDYLEAPAEAIATRLPFIWVVDSDNRMQKALVPLSWVQRCRSRIDYWQFLQEIGGTNNFHVRQTLDQEKETWEKLKEAELEAVKAQLLADFEQVRSQDLERAIKKILHALLNPDQMNQVSQAATPAPAAVVIPEKPPKVAADEEAETAAPPAEAAPVIPSEAWVETDECTSCSDCTEALPSVFKYNSDKQAFVHNPKGGSYAKIVACAEKCPAACIHPGLPHNPDEPNLEKLLKRAEKFN
jgi:ferredoxin/glutamate racemase